MGERTFRDLFSDSASEYARFRPTYPDAVFRRLASLTPAHELAWDCATGNGQAAIPLAAHFDHVIATDASEEQITQAQPHPAVEYRIAHAESSGLEEDSVDLVCCAQAVHWFDIEAFYEEVGRVLKPGGVIALLTYALPHVSDDIDSYIHAYANHILGPFWPTERTHVDAGYATLRFPFREVEMPTFEMEACWTADEMLAFLGTWSATTAYIRMMNADPRELIKADLRSRWGKQRLTVTWQLKVRAGHHDD